MTTDRFGVAIAVGIVVAFIGALTLLYASGVLETSDQRAAPMSDAPILPEPDPAIPAQPRTAPAAPQ